MKPSGAVSGSAAWKSFARLQEPAGEPRRAWLLFDDERPDELILE